MSPAWSIAFGAVAALATLLGGILVTRRTWSDLVLRSFISLGAGFMIAAVCLRMLPESMKLSPHAPLLVLMGYLLVHFFEHTAAPHLHFGEEVHSEEMVNPAVGFSALAGLSAHAFFDGVSISSGFLVSPALGFLIFFAVALHKIPEGFTVASIALASGRGVGGARTASLVLAGATLLGSVVVWRFAEGVAAYTLPLSAGVTLYVAATDLLPTVNQERGIRMALVVFLGVALFCVAERALEGFGL